MTELRSVFKPGTTRWAVRRAQWLAMGLVEEDFDKPKIAVVNSSSSLSVCYAHLDSLAAAVCASIREAGGVPFEIRTAAPSDFVTSAGLQGRYLMPTRDLLVNDIEVQVEGAVLDGMVLLSSCDKTTPGHLMAAGRLDIPSIIVVGGYQLGSSCGARIYDIEDVYKSVGKVAADQMSLDELKEMTTKAVRGPGVCAGLGTANSMHILAEALGMALPGAAPVRAASERNFDYARKSGQRIVEMIEQDLRPRQIMTRSAFRNAVNIAVAAGLSINTIRHLMATAIESNCEVDIVGYIEEAATTPLLVNVRPNGEARIEELEAAGGALAIMSEMRSRLDLDVLTVSGKALGEVLDTAPAKVGNLVHSLGEPVAKEPGLVVLRGNLAPDGAVVKLAGVPEGVARFEGVARIFEREADAIAGLRDGKVQAGDVIVLRYSGPLGGPGTVFAASFMAALVGAGFGASVAVVTDGELSGLNSGITVGQIMPEAAEGGPLAIIEDGDMILIDLKQRILSLNVADDVVARRLAALPPYEGGYRRGWLELYRQLVQPLSRGAVLGKRPWPNDVWER